MPNVKIVVFVPSSHADVVRKTMGDAGAGKIGNYDHCSFSTAGTGRFLPKAGAKPAIGSVGELEQVEEQRIEITCDQFRAAEVIKKIKQVHPYEEVALDVYPLLGLESI